MATTFNHTGITVRDLDRAEAMFRDLFDFTTFSRAPRDPDLISRVTGVAGARVEIIYMSNGETRLELLCYSAPAEREEFAARPNDLGSVHIAVNVDNMDEAYAKALAWPLEPVGEVVTIDDGPNKGSRIVYMRNPDDGLIIEMIQKPS